MAEQPDEKAIFLAALDLPAADREAFLRGACPDEAMRARIEALLRHRTEASSEFLIGSPSRAGEGLQPAPEMPDRIDEFRILAKLGEGGMGVVYLAEDTVLGRRVALKVLAPHLTGSEQALARFKEEARSTAALRHPAIVSVFKLGYDGQRQYIVSEYVDGTTLGALISEERERRREAGGKTQDAREWYRRCARTVATIADALDASHRAGIIHRDVKPSNILLDPAQGPRLTDFGIAKHLVEEARTRATDVIGSCHYMSPEQASIAKVRVDQRSDIFSLGVVMYEMLALRRPFEGDTVERILRAVVTEDPPKLALVDRLIPRDLVTICNKALEKEPDRRYQTAAHMAADLRCFLENRPILARPPTVTRRIKRWAVVNKGRSLAAASGVLLIAVVALGTSLRSSWRESRAWLTVESASGDYSVRLKREDPSTLELEAVSSANDANRHLLEPGQYRATVVFASGEFVEFDVSLFDPGRAQARTLRVVGADSENLEEHERGVGRLGSTVLSARLLPSDEVRSKGEGMVLVPGGTVELGETPDDPNPLVRRRPVTVLPFFIDRCEVSNAEYKRFLDATGHLAPSVWPAGGFDATLADRPVIGVSSDDAAAYARWCGKRLPTASEWECAMRAPDGRSLPWGAATPAVPAPVGTGTSPTWEDYVMWTLPVTSRGDLASSLELLHAVTNVRELTSTVTLGPTHAVAIKGASWTDAVADRALTKNWSTPIGAISRQTGFRCARSAQP